MCSVASWIKASELIWTEALQHTDCAHTSLMPSLFSATASKLLDRPPISNLTWATVLVAVFQSEWCNPVSTSDSYCSQTLGAPAHQYCKNAANPLISPRTKKNYLRILKMTVIIIIVIDHNIGDIKYVITSVCSTQCNIIDYLAQWLQTLSLPPFNCIFSVTHWPDNRQNTK